MLASEQVRGEEAHVMSETDHRLQIARIEEQIAHIEEQEKTLVFPTFSHEDAWRLGSLLVELARSRSLPIAIDITRGDQQVFHVGLAGSSANNDGWVARKIRVTRLFGTSSLLKRLRSELPDGEGLGALDPALYAFSGGCCPVTMAGGVIVGTVTVSGLPDVEDHALVVEAIERFLGGSD